MANEDAETRFLPEAFKKKRQQRATPPPPPAATQDEYEPDPIDDNQQFEHDGDQGGDFSFDEPASEPAERDQSVNDDGNDKLMARIDKLLDGMERLNRENADLKRQLAEKDKAPPAPKKPRIELNIDGADVDEAKLNDQFPTLLPTVRAVVRREVKSVMDALSPQLERLFDETEQKVGEVAQQTQHSRRQTFERSVAAAIPDFETVNRNPRFQEYLDGQAPMHARGVTIRAVISHAWQSQDVDTLAEIIGDFKTKNPAAPRPQHRQAANVEQFMQPGTPRQGAPQVRDPSGAGKLKQSDWNAARQKLSRGELTAAEYAPVKAKFERAKSEGRLVDDTVARASAA